MNSHNYFTKDFLTTLPIPYHPAQEVLDSTKLQTYQDCPRQFFYEYLLGWRPSHPNNHLVFGQAVHEALEHIILNGYNANSVIAASHKFEVVYRPHFPPETDDLYSPKTPYRFVDMLINYIQRYAGDIEQFEVIKTEIGGQVHLTEDIKLAYKMDTVLRDRETGLYCSLEHKTKGGNYIDKGYAIDHQMGTQCGTYTHVLNCLFPPEKVSGVIINCMCFKKTKRPEYILERFPIQLSNHMMHIWHTTTLEWIGNLILDLIKLSNHSESDDVLSAFPLCGRACSKWGRVCSYYHLCTSWPNPLQHLDKMPIDMEISFWNPLEEPLREVINL